MGVIGAAISFARSERGKRLIQQARAKYDTPENRAKARAAVADLRNRQSRPTARTAGTVRRP
jgi:hypothetical protein